ncbi:unnamed protein product, partial [Meganyctiphanes norvegica]
MGRLRYTHVTTALIGREYGTPSHTWLGLQILRCVLSGPERSWKQVLHIKENSLIEVAEDLLWITNPSAPASERGCSVMQRIGMDGKRLRLYRATLQPRLKEHLIYDLPSNVYDGALPDNEYRHVMLMLRKGNLLTRHDLCTGTMYDTLPLGSNFQCNTLMWSPTQDLLAIKSGKVKVPDQPECCFQYQIFNLHPLKKLTFFIIHGKHFPAVEDKKKYGKLRDTEIHEGLLLIITDKSYVLLYDADEVIAQSKNLKIISSDESPSSISSSFAVVTAPPLLFASWVHQDILSIGARYYIRGVNDSMLEVRELASQELVINGQVTWGDYSDQQIAPDYLLFHPDDSNRVIHARSRDVRVLALKEDGKGQQCLEEEFRYSNYKDDKTTKRISQFSRSGRLLKTTFVWDDSFNEAVTYDIDRDMDIFAVLEARRDVEHNCSIIKKVIMFNSNNYEVKSQVIINERVDGDIETNRTSLFLARDTLSIVIRNSSGHTLLMYRLVENFTKGKKKESTSNHKIRQKDYEGQNLVKKKYLRKSRKTRTMESDDEDYMERRTVQRNRKTEIRQINSDDESIENTTRTRRAGITGREINEDYVEYSPKTNKRTKLKCRESDDEYVVGKLEGRGRSQLTGADRGESSKESMMESRNKRMNRNKIIYSDTEYDEGTNTVIGSKYNERKGENKDDKDIENNSMPSTSTDNKWIRIRGWRDNDSDDVGDEDDDEDDDEANEGNRDTEAEKIKNIYRRDKKDRENLLCDTITNVKVKHKRRKLESDDDYIPPSLSKDKSFEEFNEKLSGNSNEVKFEKIENRPKRKRKPKDGHDYIPSNSCKNKHNKNSDEGESDSSENSPKPKTENDKVKSNIYHGDDTEPSTSNRRTRNIEIRWWGEEKNSSEEYSSDTRYESDSDFEVEFEKKRSKRSM